MTDRAALELNYHPLTPDRWPDLEVLFGPKGCGGCWCMYWLLRRPDFVRGLGEANHHALRALVEDGRVPGTLAYHDEQPVGWVAVGPRELYPTLDRSRILKRVDDQPVWAIVCFFVAKAHRRRGVTVGLIEAAVRWARQQGASVVEGYPVDTRETRAPVFVYTGLASAFRKAGFVEVARRSPTRPIVRYTIGGGQP